MKARRMHRSSQMAIVATDAAMREAGWEVEREGAEALGIFLGSGFCGTDSSLSMVQTLYESGAEEVSAAAFPNTVPNAPAGQMAIFFSLEGPSATLLQTGTTAESALLCACGQIEAGQCRAALWGGVDELSEYLWYGLQRLGWTAEPSDDESYGRPLEPLGQGFIPGEAAAVVVVEPETTSREGRPGPKAVIEYAATGAIEAQPWAYPRIEQLEAAVPFFAEAIKATGPPHLVIGCANGHPDLDDFEAAVLQRIVGDGVPIWFAKGQVGETMASAALRAALAVWLIEEGFVPANSWLKSIAMDRGLAIPTEPTDRDIGRVLVPTISAGGTLGAVVIAR
jgi:3-oxoacyl-(acyl-carrier-protein) synthase